MARRKAEGYIFGRPPYGYTKQNGVLIEIPEEQAIIEQVLEMHEAGINMATIARELEISSRQQVRNIVKRFSEKNKNNTRRENVRY